MKTLLVTRRTDGFTWLETDSGFALIFQDEPETIREAVELAPGKRLFFMVDGERVTDPRIPYVVRRLSVESTPAVVDGTDVVGAILALAIFVSGLVSVAS